MISTPFKAIVKLLSLSWKATLFLLVHPLVSAALIVLAALLTGAIPLPM